MPSRVTYKGYRDRRLDGTTEVEAEVDGKTYRFPVGIVGGQVSGSGELKPGPVPDAVVERLSGDDLKGHQFDIEDAEAGEPAAAELRGQALEQALADRELDTSGNADEKRARVTEFDANSEEQNNG